MEGTGSFGAGLLRFLADYGLTVIEVDRPDRAGRCRNGKSDPLDAESAARAVQSGRATGTPKSRDAQVEMIRVLRVARRGAMKARILAGAQLDALIVTAPEQVRAQLRKLTSKQRIRACAALRPGPVSDPASAVKTAPRHSASDAPRPGGYVLPAHTEAQGRDRARGGTADGLQVNAGWADRRGERRAAAEQHGHDVDHDLVNEPVFQALAGEVSAEYLDVLAACGLPGRGDRSLDVTGQEGDRWITRSLRGPVGEHELRSLPRAFVGFAGWFPGIALTYLVGPPAREDGTGRRHDFRCLARGRILKDPVHAVARPRDEAVQRHRAVHDHFPGYCASIAHEVPSIAADPPGLQTSQDRRTHRRVHGSTQPFRGDLGLPARSSVSNPC